MRLVHHLNIVGIGIIEVTSVPDFVGIGISVLHVCAIPVEIVGRNLVDVHLGRELALSLRSGIVSEPMLIEGLHELKSAIHDAVLPFHCSGIERNRAVVAYGNLVCRGVLGSDENHTVSGSRSIDN